MIQYQYKTNMGLSLGFGLLKISLLLKSPVESHVQIINGNISIAKICRKHSRLHGLMEHLSALRYAQ